MAGVRGRDAVADELRDRIITGLHVGRLRGGERMPSVRALATELDINERVVLAALHTLAREGFVELRERSGVYVLPPHPASADGLPHLEHWLIAMLLQARARGLAPRDVADFVHRRLASRRVRAACIECNNDQLHLLCSELADDHGYASEGIHLDELDARQPAAALKRADVLVTTTFHVNKVQRVARALGKPWIAVALRPDLMRDIARRMQHGPVYYVATDRRYERKLRRMLAPFGSTANLRVYIVPGDDVTEIPDDAPTFVMTSARAYLRDKYGARGGPGNLLQPPRHFSDDAARQLLTFMVRANST